MKRCRYEIIFYDFDMMIDMLECITNKANQFDWAKEFKYAYCKHDKDLNRYKEFKKLHYHCVLEFVKPIESERLFNVINEFLPNHKETDIEKAGVAVWSYLIHANTPEKHQYEFNDVISNLDEDVLWERIEKYRITKRQDLECQYIMWIAQIRHEIIERELCQVISDETLIKKYVIKISDLLNFIMKDDLNGGVQFEGLASFIIHHTYFVKELL